MHLKLKPAAYDDLEAEVLCKLYVEEIPLVVFIGCKGNNHYEVAAVFALQEPML